MSKYTQLKNNIPYILLFLVPLVLILPSIGNIYYSPGSEYSDLAITHLPNAEFIKHSILVDHQLPLWNPLIMSGFPFVGDPLSGLWYPPGWLALLFSLPFGLNLVTALHIGAGALGLFKLLNRLSVRREIALIFGLCFALLPKIYAHFGAGHITYLYAVCLTPLLMWSEASRIEGKSFLNKTNIGLFALIVLADMRWFPFALIAWVCIVIISRMDKPNVSGETIHIKSNPQKDIGKIFLKLSGEGIIGLLIAAPLLLPFFEFLHRSTRILMNTGENLIYSLPTGRLLGLFIPPNGGFPEWIIYPGIGIIVLVIVSLSTRNWKIILPTGLFIFSLVWALGNNIAIIGLLESLPGLNLIRVPPRVVFLGDMMAILASALSLEWILHQTDEKVNRRLILIIIGTGIFFILLAAGIGILQGYLSNSISHLLIMAPLFVGSLILSIKNNQKLYPVLLIGIVLIADLYLSDITLFGPSNNLNVPVSRTIEIIKNDKSLFRVYSPTYSIGQEVAGRAGIQLVQGVNPMQLASYVRYLETATSILYQNYSVVIPPLMDPNTESEIKARTLNEENRKYLNELNIKYVIFNSSLVSGQGWKLISNSDGQWLYENVTTTSRAAIMTSNNEPITDGIYITKYSPNEIIISIDQPEEIILELRDINYPGWRVWVDGIEKPISSCEIFRCVSLPLNTNQVIFRYQPFSFYLGLLISGLLMMMIFFIKKQTEDDR